MKLLFLSLYILLPILLQAQTTQPPPTLGPLEIFMQMIPMFAIVFLIIYLMVIKPQRQEHLNQQKFYENLKKGDKVVTSSGIIGKVFNKNDTYLTLELENNARVQIESKSVVKLFEQTIS
jgi:preprotein translocase subunit YajC